MGAEREQVADFGRLEDGLRQAGEWYRWGPNVSERQWGTVREDYSADGNAWDYLPHDHARSRACRWGEDGLAGFCDVEQRLCLSLALWNGRDPILKERAYGLTGPQGNHGEDVKEYWWYLDAVPSHAWNRWRYHYPQGPFPYQDLIDVNARRSQYEPEYELLDTGAFDGDRYWITEVHYAKAGPDDLLMSIQVTNAGPEAETVHVLPTAWFRNTWSWDAEATEPRPGLRASGDRSVTIDHPFLGPLELIAAAGPDGTGPQVLFCENETNLARLYGAAPVTPYPKDGINDHVIHGAPTINPVGDGTKCAFWYQVTMEPGQTAELRLRLRPADGGQGRSAAKAAAALGKDFDQMMAARRAEADEFYAELTPAGASADKALVLRQASAGMLWSKQLFYYDVARWLDGAFDKVSAFLDMVAQDPVVCQAKLVAEPWDVGQMDSYDLGRFPPLWREWNGKYRDTMRDFWRSHPVGLGEFANRFSGSPDLYGTVGRRPTASVNLITVHDGFTLRDLVSYDDKHNEANGENNRDGTSDNNSWNCGAEGPTDDPDILALRARQSRAMLTTLMLSFGVPMLLGGDEMGRTQGGNNNAYCQDNEMTWVDWASADAALLDFTRNLIAFRRAHPVFRRRRFLAGAEATELQWFTPAGTPMNGGDWADPNARAIAIYLDGSDDPDLAEDGTPLLDDDFLVLVNSWWEPLGFVLSATRPGAQWHAGIDSHDPTAPQEPPNARPGIR